jgi:ribose-phosphate pyrophosphokinase
VGRSLALFAFRDGRSFASRLAREVGGALRRLDVHRFPDGESLVVARGRPGRHAALVRSLHDPDRKLVEVLLAADALRRAGAERVTLVAPYLPYMRQDAVFHAGEPVSQRVIGRLLGAAFDGVVTLEAHLHRIRELADVIPGRAASLSAAPLFAAWLRSRGESTLVVGPDEESEPWVRAVADLARAPWVVGRKQRLGDHRVRVALPPLPEARRAVLVDDVASTGATLAVAARALARAGIARIEVAVAHALFAPGARERLARAGVRRVVSCDSVPHATNGIRTAPLFASWLRSAA